MTDNIGDESSKLRREGIPFAARMGEFAPRKHPNNNSRKLFLAVDQLFAGEEPAV